MLDALMQQLKNLPTQTGVYTFRSNRGVPLYIGKANNIAARVKQHLTPPFDAKHMRLINEARVITFETCAREEEALLLEQRLIKQHRPCYNTEWKDGKQYVSIGLRKERFPRIFLIRQQRKEKGVEYFGPFVDSVASRALIRYVSRVIPCCSCTTKQQHHCLAWKLWRQKGWSEDADRDTLRAIRTFLRRGIPALRLELGEQMEQSARRQQFERAAHIRDIITRLDRITARAPKEKTDEERARGSEQSKAVQLLLKLERVPARIEGYDISNMQGDHAVGSMIVFLDGLSRPDLYRQFRIKTVVGANDVAMIAEVIRRRLRRLRNEPKLWPAPDLILIDGGIPQLNSAREEILKARKKIFVASLAKREERIMWNDGGFQDIKLPNDHLALHLFQAIRDEAHRFARKHTRRLYQKKIQNAPLTG